MHDQHVQEAPDIHTDSEQEHIEEGRRADRAHDPCDQREDTERRELHHDGRDLEHQFRAGIEHVRERLAAFGRQDQTGADEDGEEDHREYVALRKSRKGIFRHDPHQPICQRTRAIERGRFRAAQIDAHARTQDQRQHDADHDGAEGGAKVQRDRLSADRAEAFRILHCGDAGHQCHEHQRHDQHLDHADEQVADPLDLLARIADEKPGNRAEHQRGQNAFPQHYAEPSTGEPSDHGQVPSGGWRSTARPGRAPVACPWSIAPTPLTNR